MSWCVTPRSAYAFIAPAFFLLLFLVAYPFVLSVWLSLSDARIGETGNFVGLENFQRLLTSSIFLQTLQNSIVFTAAALGAKTVFGMALALLLFPHRTIQAADPGRRAAAVHRADRAEHAGVVVDVRAALQRRELDPQSLHIVNKGHPLAAGPVPGHVHGGPGQHLRGLPFFAITILAGLVAIRASCTRRPNRTEPGPSTASGTSRCRCSSPYWAWSSCSPLSSRSPTSTSCTS